MKTLLIVFILIHLSLLSISNASPATSWDNTTRVAHGQQAKVGQFKSVVALLFMLTTLYSAPIETLCTGSIISEQWVLTAVHCVGHHMYYKTYMPGEILYYDIKIIAGVNDFLGYLPSRQERTAHGDDYHIFPGSLDAASREVENNRRLMPGIDAYIDRVLNGVDIALIHVAKPFEFNAKVGSIKLARNYILDGIVSPSPCYSVGYGETLESSYTQTKLNFIRVKAGGKTVCEKFKNDYTGSAYHMCSKGLDNKRANICSGDSGGPLVCGEGDARVNAGVLSYYSLKSGATIFFDSMDCGKSKKGVATYMFPGHAEKWISEIMDAPIFVSFLKKTDYSGASVCKPLAILCYVLLFLALISLLC